MVSDLGRPEPNLKEVLVPLRHRSVSSPTLLGHPPTRHTSWGHLTHGKHINSATESSTAAVTVIK
jgi:hypothetical protein